MNHQRPLIVIVAALLGLFFGAELRADESPVKLVPVLKINKDLDKRTVIKASAIPSAGNGLFAAVEIQKGQVIGELGGRLLKSEEYPVSPGKNRRPCFPSTIKPAQSVRFTTKGMRWLQCCTGTA